MRLRAIVIFFCMICHVLYGQEYPRDTSFNLRDDFTKNLKTHPEISFLATVDQGVSRFLDIPYPTSGKRQLKLDLYSPEEVLEKLPVILMVHGGGWRSGNKEMMAALASNLSVLGYHVVVPEYRLSLEAVYPAGIRDLEHALLWCVAHSDLHNIDTSKIVAAGTSSGGQMVSQLGNNLHAGFRIAATVNIDGTVKLTPPQDGKVTPLSSWLGGNVKECSANWIEASPVLHIGPSTAPTLFLASGIPRFQEGRDAFVTALDKYNIPHHTHIFFNSPHTFWFYHPWSLQMVNFIDLFLSDVLSPCNPL